MEMIEGVIVVLVTFENNVGSFDYSLKTYHISRVQKTQQQQANKQTNNKQAR